jgi:hypothetical protein
VGVGGAKALLSTYTVHGTTLGQTFSVAIDAVRGGPKVLSRTRQCRRCRKGRYWSGRSRGRYRPCRSGLPWSSLDAGSVHHAQLTVGPKHVQPLPGVIVTTRLKPSTVDGLK